MTVAPNKLNSMAAWPQFSETAARLHASDVGRRALDAAGLAIKGISIHEVVADLSAPVLKNLKMLFAAFERFYAPSQSCDGPYVEWTSNEWTSNEDACVALFRGVDVFDHGIVPYGSEPFNSSEAMFGSMLVNLMPLVWGMKRAMLFVPEAVAWERRYEFAELGGSLPTMSQFISLYSKPAPAMTDDELQFRHQLLEQLKGTGQPFNDYLAQRLGSNYLCALADGSVVAYTGARVLRHHATRDVMVFDASNSANLSDAQVDEMLRQNFPPTARQ